MTGAFNKQVFSTFTGRAIADRGDQVEEDRGVGRCLRVRFRQAEGGGQPLPAPRDVLVLEMDKWAVAYLNGRKMISIPLAKTGDCDRRQILAEYALVARNEKASGGVFDNTTS